MSLKSKNNNEIFSFDKIDNQIDISDDLVEFWKRNNVPYWVNFFINENNENLIFILRNKIHEIAGACFIEKDWKNIFSLNYVCVNSKFRWDNIWNELLFNSFSDFSIFDLENDLIRFNSTNPWFWYRNGFAERQFSWWVFMVNLKEFRKNIEAVLKKWHPDNFFIWNEKVPDSDYKKVLDMYDDFFNNSK